MKRRLFTILSTFSLLLFVAVVVMWVRSYSTEDFLYVHSGRSNAQLTSSLGRLQFYPNALVRWGLAAVTPVQTGWHHHAQPVWPHPPIQGFRPAEYSWRLWGFRYWEPHRGMPCVQWPYWSVALVMLVLPAARVRQWIKSHRRRRIGLCSSCGYDLRATRGRCPECGRATSDGAAREGVAGGGR